MRTTIRIDDQLLKEAKQLAARTGKSLTVVIEEALRESLSRQRKSRKREPVTLTTFGGQGLLAGVDLDDTVILLDLMDSTHDPD